MFYGYCTSQPRPERISNLQFGKENYRDKERFVECFTCGQIAVQASERPLLPATSVECVLLSDWRRRKARLELLMLAVTHGLST